MFGIHDYWLFVGTGIMLNLIPGQDTAFILGRALSGGQRAGVAAALGISVGSLCHTLAAALGFSALIAASATAFAIVKLAGATYLILLGIRLLFARAASAADAVSLPAQRGPGAASCFKQGILTNVLNPKVALFFLALLPQFIDPASRSKPAAFFVLGISFIITGTLWSLVLALAAARLREFFAGNPAVRTWLDRVTGALFVTLGARLAWKR
jgi:threonine/homoserine/homoserine lactone efflux protein